jgi:hypothetical protein
MLRVYYSWTWWLTPAILATQEAKIRRIAVSGYQAKKPEIPSQPMKSWPRWHTHVAPTQGKCK